MKKLTVIKIGGHVVDDEQKLNGVLKQFADLDGPKILVHGGGKLASQISNQMGITPQMIEGRRITDAENLKVVQMVYAGLINTNIVARLQSHNCNALGINGADGNSILAKKRLVKKIDFGYVGDVTKVNPRFIKRLLAIGVIPVFCALTHDGNGQILNTNADTIASELSVALSKDYNVDLVYCFEKKGVLQDEKKEDSVIPFIDKAYYAKLRDEKIITDGMIPKIDNAFDALNKGLDNVFIIRYDDLDKIKSEDTPGSRISL
jgi:acetylglutamate kinase